MSEDLAPQTYEPYGWEDVAAEYGSWHEGLQPHVERHLTAQGLLPATATPEHTGPEAEADSTLDDYVSMLYRVSEAELSDIFDAYYNSGLADIVENGNYTTEELDGLVRACTVLDQRASEPEGDIVAKPVSHDMLLDVLHRIPPAKLQEFYFSDDAAAAGGLRDTLLEITADHDTMTYEYANLLKLLRDAYEIQNVLDLTLFKQSDPIVKQLVAHESFATSAVDIFMQEEDAANYNASDEHGRNPVEQSRTIRDWGDRYLDAVVGLPRDISDDFQYASYDRTTNLETGLVVTFQFMNAVETMRERVRKLGIDTIRQLHDHAGITNFDYYSVTQLHRMADVLNRDPNTIAELRKGDTTVVFTDARGDYNGAMSSNGVEFEKPTNRTLFFEINRPSDFYRHMTLLKERGIKPSTLVVAAHGDPGMIVFGGKFHLSNELNDPDQPQQVSVPKSKGIARLVAEYMQDSRGVDDNPEAVGRRRVILKSCSQAKPAVVWRRNGSGHTSAHESMAETLLGRAAHPRLDVYAGALPFGLERTARGIRMKAVIDTAKGQQISPLDATHLSLDAQGAIVVQRVDEIVLDRKQDEAEDE